MKIRDILKELKSVDSSGKRVWMKDIIGKPEPEEQDYKDEQDYEDYEDEQDYEDYEDEQDYEDEVEIDEPEQQPVVKKTKSKKPDPVSKKPEPPKTVIKQPTVAKSEPKENPNATLKSKIEYLKREGHLQSGRITDDEKRYIDGVEVYVDPNKFDNVSPNQPFLSSTPPHHLTYIASVQIPLDTWMRLMGREPQGFTGIVSFDLTPAGWWSPDFQKYVNPNNPLSEVIDQYQKD